MGVFLYALYTGTAALGSLVLLNKLKQLQPYHEEAMKAQEKKNEIAKRFGRPPIDTNRYEDVIACDVINPDHIDVEFDCIGGLEGIKQELFELVILPLRRPELFSCGKLLGLPKGVLLYGPPGTGKTMLAKAIAAESGAVFINVKISNLLSKWLGESQKLVAAVFSLANKLQPAIIFIDEVDSFLGQRRDTEHGALTRMKTEFMAQWDGLTTDQNARVMVFAATNRRSKLDEAILRRFSQSFEVGLPARKEREEILKVILRGQNVEHNIDYEHIASLCERYSSSDLLDVCKKAAYLPIREFLDDEKSGKSSHLTDPRPLRQSDIENVLATSKRTSTAAQDFTKQRDGDEYPIHSKKVLATLKKTSMAAQDYTKERDGKKTSMADQDCREQGDGKKTSMAAQDHTKKRDVKKTEDGKKMSMATQDCTKERDGKKMSMAAQDCTKERDDKKMSMAAQDCTKERDGKKTSMAAQDCTKERDGKKTGDGKKTSMAAQDYTKERDGKKTLMAAPVYGAKNEPSKLGRRFFVFFLFFAFCFSCFSPIRRNLLVTARGV